MSNEKAEIVPPVALLRWAFGLGILVDVGMFVHSGWITGLIAWAGIGLVGVVFMDRIANFIVRIPDRVTRRGLLVGGVGGSGVIVVLYSPGAAVGVPGGARARSADQGRPELPLLGTEHLRVPAQCTSPDQPLPELGAVEHSLLPARQAHTARRALRGAERRGVRGRVRSLAARHHDGSG